MKWVKTIALLFLCFAFAARTGLAEEKEPWGFENIAVINLPTARVSVERAVDNKAVELKFDTWNPTLEEVFKTSLSLSPLSYRLFPARQTAMFVEVFSNTSEVDFAVRPQKGGLQMIIGEIRSEAAISKILSLPDSTDPIAKVADLVREGQYSAARHALFEHDKHNRISSLLFKVRVSLIDYIKGGRSGIPCPRITSISPHDASDIEAILLNAWCEKNRKNLDMALYYADLVKNLSKKGAFPKLAEAMEQTIVSGRILTAERLNNPIVAAAHAVAHMDIIQKLLPEVTFIETVADNLMEVGLAAPLSKMLQESMARDTTGSSGVLEPILVETYLVGRNIVPALDSATYFLSKRRPTWSTARLKRSQGLALLQTGDWKGAAKSLGEARKLGAAWSSDDELSFIEAELRGNTPIETITKSIEDFTGNAPKLNKFQKAWLMRIQAEATLRQGGKVSKEALGALPAHALYRAAETLKAEGKTDPYTQLMQEIAKRKSGWSELAKLSMEIDKTTATVAEMTQIMEKMQ